METNALRNGNWIYVHWGDGQFGWLEADDCVNSLKQIIDQYWELERKLKLLLSVNLSKVRTIISDKEFNGICAQLGLTVAIDADSTYFIKFVQNGHALADSNPIELPAAAHECVDKSRRHIATRWEIKQNFVRHLEGIRTDFGGLSKEELRRIGVSVASNADGTTTLDLVPPNDFGCNPEANRLKKELLGVYQVCQQRVCGALASANCGA